MRRRRRKQLGSCVSVSRSPLTPHPCTSAARSSHGAMQGARMRGRGTSVPVHVRRHDLCVSALSRPRRCSCLVSCTRKPRVQRSRPASLHHRRPGMSVSSTPASTISLPSLLSASLDLARQAGVIIRDIFNSGNLGAIDKAQPSASSPAQDGSLTDPQTLADLASQRLILSSLSRTFPGLQIVGEEGDVPASPSDIHCPALDLVAPSSLPPSLQSLPLSDVTVWVDPLDGTKEFTLGYVEYVTVLIGITVKGRAVAGVIGQPFTGNVVWGCEGAGVHGVQPHNVRNFHDETFTPISATPLSPSAPASRVIVTTRSHFTPLLSSLLASLHPTKIIRSGGAGSKTLLLLSGAADCYFFPSPGLKYWDVVAPEAVVKAAGGQATDSWGREWHWDERAGREGGYQVDGGFIATMKDHAFYVLPKDVDIIQAHADA